MNRPDVIIRGIQNDFDASKLLDLALRFKDDHPDHKPRDVVIYKSYGYVHRMTVTCHWTRNRATIVVERHHDEG